MRTSDPSCTNCQGWGCMDCVLRYWHDNCEHTCPMCEPLAEVGLGRRDASETTPDSPGDTIPGTETEGSRR